MWARSASQRAIAYKKNHRSGALHSSTRLRAIGLGVSVVAGRMGAMLAPLLLTLAYQESGTPSSAPTVLVILAAPGPICALLCLLFGRETRNVSLSLLKRAAWNILVLPQRLRWHRRTQPISRAGCATNRATFSALCSPVSHFDYGGNLRFPGAIHSPSAA